MRLSLGRGAHAANGTAVDLALTRRDNEGAIAMSDEKTPDYRKFKTHGGVTTTKDGDVHPTSLTDESRAAQVAALKNERQALAGRVEADEDDKTASRRLREVERSLARFGEKVERTPGQPPEKTAK